VRRLRCREICQFRHQQRLPTLCGRNFSGAGASTCDSSCAAGRYGAAGDTSCQPCAAGKFSPAGASACTSCLPGKFSASAVAGSCTECPAGRYSGTGGSSLSNCTPCESGEYSSTGSSYCSVAGPGTKPNSERTGIESCPIHTSSIGASDICTPCTNGHAPVRSATCFATPNGHYYHAGDEKDRPCPAGRFSEGASTIAGCLGCEDGMISNLGSSFCAVCESGTKSNANHTVCEDCPTGTYSGTKSSSCTSCENGMFNDEVKQDSCRSCDKFGVKNSFASSSDSPPSSKLSCICSKGDFRILLSFSSAVLVAECQPCEGVTSDSGVSKEGLICNEVGLTTETLKLSPGYWRSGNSSVKIEMCENVGDCPQKNVTQQCEDGHEGPICANCLPGHTRSVSGSCEECEETSSSSMLTLLACLIPLSLILSRVLKRRMKNTSIADVHNKKHWANRLKTKVKILSSSFQIVCEFAATLKVSFPPVFSGFTKWVSTIVQFDFISIGSFGCMMEMNYYGSLLLYTLAPIVITLLLVVYILLGKVMHRR